jgi:type IV pilus assembly protein PilM
MHTLSSEERDQPGSALKVMLKKFKIAANGATLSLPKEQATLLHVSLPSTNPEDLKGMARFEAERHIPFNAERHGVGFQALRPDGVGGSEVLLAAADGPIIDRAIESARQAGMRPEGLNVSSACLVNALLHAQPEIARNKTAALVSIGLQSLDLVFSVQGRIVFSRSVPHGLRGLIRDWSAAGPAANVDLDPMRVAAGAKMIDMMDLDHVYGEGEGVAATQHGAGPGDAARAWSKKLIQEITRSYDFARREMNCPPIEAVVLAGEGAILRNLDKYLFANLNVPVGTLHPVAKLKGKRPTRLPFGGLELAVPFGAAIQGAVKGGYQIDLTPNAHYRRMDRRRLWRNVGFSGAMAAIAIAMSAMAMVELRRFRAEELAAYTQANREVLRERAQKIRDDEDKLDILEAFFSDPAGALRVLDYVGIADGNERISLTSVQYVKGETVTVQGHAMQTEDIARLEETMRRSPLFQDAQTTDQRVGRGELPGRPPVYVFEIQCRIAEFSPSEQRRRRAEEATIVEAPGALPPSIPAGKETNP